MRASFEQPKPETEPSVAPREPLRDFSDHSSEWLASLELRIEETGNEIIRIESSFASPSLKVFLFQKILQERLSRLYHERRVLEGERDRFLALHKTDKPTLH